MLNSLRKWKWFERHWTRASLRDALQTPKSAYEELWIQEYKLPEAPEIVVWIAFMHYRYPGPTTDELSWN